MHKYIHNLRGQARDSEGPLGFHTFGLLKIFAVQPNLTRAFVINPQIDTGTSRYMLAPEYAHTRMCIEKTSI